MKNVSNETLPTTLTTANKQKGFWARLLRSAPLPHRAGNESGFTLIEVMIVSVIAVVLGLAIAEMQSQQAKTTKRLEVKTSAQDFYNVLKFQIVNSAVQTANQAP